MKITINNHGAFVQHKNEIGISLYPNDNCVHFFDKDATHKILKHSEVTSIRKEFLVDELLENVELRDLANHHNLISICNFDRVSYLNYARMHS